MKKIFLFFVLAACYVSLSAQGNFPKWEKGYMDIHHIETGRGNCCFIMMPDGTTMMIDAGDFDVENFEKNYAPMYAPQIYPNNSYTVGSSIINYLSNIMGTGKAHIDYFLLTHFHNDHYGSVVPSSPASDHGYKLAGVTAVGDVIPIKHWVDRAWPEYDYPIDLKNNPDGNGGVEPKSFENLLKFVSYQVKEKGMKAEQFKVGTDRQFRLLNDAKAFPTFSVRNIKANNIVWTGNGSQTRELFTKSELLAKKRYNDNQMSTAIVVRYGDFKYYAGGDNSGLVDQDHQEWYDIESQMAPVIGHVEAMSLNHHSNRDASNQTFLNTLDPKVVVAQAWSPDHPGAEVGHRLISSNIGTQKRDIFYTYFCPETSIGMGPWFERRLKSKLGSVVIRVNALGEYKVYVLDARKSTPTVIGTFGPYKSSKKIL